MKQGQNLETEAILDPSISFNWGSQRVELDQDPKAIFLTGASGFLGAFFLHTFLQKTGADIFCLVRAYDEWHAKDRIQKNLEQFSLWKDDWSKRVIPVIGNLAQPYLGLSEEKFQDLANQIDFIFHNGASVNLIYPYQRLKAANVLGTQEVIRLAAGGKPKVFHFISTLVVFPITGHPQGKSFSEEDPLIHSQGLLNGYAESKWVAEKLVQAARSRGLPVVIYRVGEVFGHSKTGILQTLKNDAYSNIFKETILLGSTPALNFNFYLVPVDYVGKSIYYLSRMKSSLGQVYHIIGEPTHFSELPKLFARIGHPLRLLPYGQWLEGLSNFTRNNTGTTLAALKPFIESPIITQLAQQNGLFKLENQKTLAALANSSLTCPPPEELFANQYSSLRHIFKNE